MRVWNIGETYNADFITDGAQNDTITVLSVKPVKATSCDVETKEIGSCFAKGRFEYKTREVYSGHVMLYTWGMCPFHAGYFDALPVPNVMDTLFPDNPADYPPA